MGALQKHSTRPRLGSSAQQLSHPQLLFQEDAASTPHITLGMADHTLSMAASPDTTFLPTCIFMRASLCSLFHTTQCQC